MIFVDRNIGKSVVEAIRAAGFEAIWLTDEFPQDAPDVAWLEVAGKSGWLVITRDKRIRTSPGERTRAADARVGLFIIAARANLGRRELAQLVVDCLPKMVELHQRVERPFIICVYRNGKMRYADPVTGAIMMGEEGIVA